jgi:hypothetical protein
MVAAVVAGAEDRLLTFQATAQAAPQAQPRLQPPHRPSSAERTPEPSPTPGALRSGPVTVVARTFALGGSHACHLVGGTARCRGANDRGQGGDGTLTGLVALAAGVSHGCGLDVTGGAWCWGANEAGQLGDGTTQDRRPQPPWQPTPASPPGGRTVPHLWADGWRPGRVLGSQRQRPTREWYAPGPLPAGARAGQPLVPGAGGGVEPHLRDHARRPGRLLGLQRQGTDRGRIPGGPGGAHPGPGHLPGLAAGASHTCGISGRHPLLGGQQLRAARGWDHPGPQPPPWSSELPGTALALAAGAVHTCAVLTDRTAWCWGQNLQGQLGDGTNTHRSSPVAVSGRARASSRSSQPGAVTCGFARDGTEYCWGLNQSGQLGDGTRTNRSVPTRVIQ